MVVTPYSEKASPRFSGAKLSPRIDCAIGCKPPPNAPCMTRNRRRNPRLGAIPQRKELTVKNTMQVKKKRFRPAPATSQPLSSRTVAFGDQIAWSRRPMCSRHCWPPDPPAM